MTTLEPGEIEIIEDAAADAGAGYRDDYSGRGMYGDKCIGLTGSMAEITRAIVQVGRADSGLAGQMADTMRTDNMGLDFIAYWPSMLAPGEDDES